MTIELDGYRYGDCSFLDISAVTPPLALPGEIVERLINGKWEPYRIERVFMHRKDRAQVWRWMYAGRTARGKVSVQSQGSWLRRPMVRQD